MMNRMTKNIDEAKQALTTKPLFATSVERVLIMNEIKSKYNDLPQPLRFARSLNELLSRVSVPVEPYDLIVGRCVDRELTQEEEQIYQDFLVHPDYPRNYTFFDSGHCTYSWESVIELGLPGLRERAEKQLERYPEEEKQNFLKGMIEAYDAIKNYMLRYADAAESKGMTAVAENLRRAATQRKNNFWSGLQLLWTITFILCSYITPNPTLTVGHLDRILYPLYEADIKNGTLTREQAAEIITDYYCKHNLNMGRGEHQIGDESNSTTFERIFNFDAPQYLQLCGYELSGKPTVNELTQLFVECIQPAFKNPVVVVQYYPHLNEEHPKLWAAMMEKAIQSSSMMFYNDRNVVDCIQRIGLPWEDAVKHAHFGCNWSSMGENSSWMASGPSAERYDSFYSKEEEEEYKQVRTSLRGQTHLVQVFMDVFREMAAREDATIEDLFHGFFKTVADNLNIRLNNNAQEIAIRQRNPAKLIKYADLFLNSAAEYAESNAARAKYFSKNTSFVYFATVVDCFIAVDKLVYMDKKVTLRQLLEALDANFEGYPEILAMCRNADKFGSDTPLSNGWARRLADEFCNTVILVDKPYLEKSGVLAMPNIQCDTGHLKVGSRYGATPDGRLAGVSFSQNARPAYGSCINGLTGMFNSLLSIPHDTWASGALNMEVDPKQFAGEKGRDLFGEIFGSFLNRGGLHAQITATNVEELLDAQKNPDQHRDLRVRVTGYSGVFVDICKKLQDDIIKRFQ